MLAEVSDRAALDLGWERLDTELDAPRPGWFEGLLVRGGVGDGTARLLAATPVLRRSWLGAVAAVLVTTFFVAFSAGAAERPTLFLALAPLLPLAGVALAYGPVMDPTYEMAVVSPMHGFRLLMIRTVAVLVVALGVNGLASLAMPGYGLTALAWLLPGLALTTAGLALTPGWARWRGRRRWPGPGWCCWSWPVRGGARTFRSRRSPRPGRACPRGSPCWVPGFCSSSGTGSTCSGGGPCEVAGRFLDLSLVREWRMTPTVSASGLSLHYGRTRALDDVSLRLTPGVTGLLGPNGAGKTTLLRVLATAVPADHGAFTVLGHDPGTSRGRQEVRRRLGYLPQTPGFHQDFTAFEFVDYVAILKELAGRRERHREVRRVLEDVGLGDVRGRKIKKLSGGCGSGSPWPPPWWATRGSWCWTSRPWVSIPSSGCGSAS